MRTTRGYNIAHSPFPWSLISSVRALELAIALATPSSHPLRGNSPFSLSLSCFSLARNALPTIRPFVPSPTRGISSVQCIPLSSPTAFSKFERDLSTEDREQGRLANVACATSNVQGVSDRAAQPERGWSLREKVTWKRRHKIVSFFFFFKASFQIEKIKFELI